MNSGLFNQLIQGTSAYKGVLLHEGQNACKPMGVAAVQAPGRGRSTRHACWHLDRWFLGVHATSDHSSSTIVNLAVLGCAQPQRQKQHLITFVHLSCIHAIPISKIVHTLHILEGTSAYFSQANHFSRLSNSSQDLHARVKPLTCATYGLPAVAGQSSGPG